MTDRRCFLQWFVIALAYCAITLMAFDYGVPQSIFQTDTTYMTSVIAAIFVVAVLYLGYASWRYDALLRIAPSMTRLRQNTADADIGIATKASYVVTLFGLLGTVMGLQHQVQAMAAVSPDNLTPFLTTVSSALGTAFYATGCGIVASIGIIAMAANLEYFADGGR